MATRTTAAELKRSPARGDKAKAKATAERITENLARFNRSGWDLARACYDFHEGGYWLVLGFATLDKFLEQPHIDITRTYFFRLSSLWRDLVVTKGIKPSALNGIGPSKAQFVRNSIMDGKEHEAALADARELTTRELQRKYGYVPHKGRGEMRFRVTAYLSGGNEITLTVPRGKRAKLPDAEKVVAIQVEATSAHDADGSK